MARKELSPACLAVVQVVTVRLDEGDGPVVIGCSGGPDSMALAAAAAHLARRSPELAGRISCCVVDHGLQDASDEVAAQVAGRVTALGLRATVVRVDAAPRQREGTEAAARHARYQALAAHAGPGGQVWLGHTLDDQAETVLLGLARGSGTRSLAGMADDLSVDGIRFVRPLLGLRRATTVQACSDWDLTVWHDPHNTDPRFTRVRVRTRVLPVLEAELGPGVAEALARTAELARADADELDARAAALLPQPGPELPVDLLDDLPAALAGRVLRRWLVAVGVPEPGQGHVRAVSALVTDWHGQRGVDLPGGSRVVRGRGVLRLMPPSPPPATAG